MPPYKFHFRQDPASRGDWETDQASTRQQDRRHKVQLAIINCLMSLKANFFPVCLVRFDNFWGKSSNVSFNLICWYIHGNKTVSILLRKILYTIYICGRWMVNLITVSKYLLKYETAFNTGSMFSFCFGGYLLILKFSLMVCLVILH